MIRASHQRQYSTCLVGDAEVSHLAVEAWREQLRFGEAPTSVVEQDHPRNGENKRERDMRQRRERE